MGENANSEVVAARTELPVEVREVRFMVLDRFDDVRADVVRRVVVVVVRFPVVVLFSSNV